MEIQSYEDWNLELDQQAVSQRIPLGGSIEVTRRCPHTCLHCYNNLPLTDKLARRSELTYKEHCRILDEIAEAGCLWLLYTGGEIFSRKDFPDIYAYAKQKGMLITLFTNGVLITPEIADFLIKWRPYSIEITIYGSTKETYEKITGIPGSFERCMRGIRLLMERGLPLKLKTVVLTLNKHELWDMKRFVEQDLGLEFKFDAMVNPRIDCSLSPLEVRLTPLEVVELDLMDPKRVKEWKKFAQWLSDFHISPEHRDEMYECSAGVVSFAIDPYGKLSICSFLSSDSWDLRKGGFRQGWEVSLLQERRKKITKKTKCWACGIKAMCGMCPANGELENKNPEMPVDFLCQVAHLRAYALGLPIAPHGDCEYCEGGAGYKELIRSVETLRQVKDQAARDQLRAALVT